MNKKLKKALIKHHEETRAAFPHLYDEKWVEKSADEGWKEVVDNLCKEIPGFREVATGDSGMNVLAILYYSAFECALNTFFKQCMEDTMTNAELCLDELHKLTATIKEVGV